MRAQLENSEEYKQSKRTKELPPLKEIPLTAEALQPPASPVRRLLAQVRNERPNDALASEREILESLLGKDRAEQLIASAAIIVDSTGEAIAAKPDPAPATSQEIPRDPAKAPRSRARGRRTAAEAESEMERRARWVSNSHGTERGSS